MKVSWKYKDTVFTGTVVQWVATSKQTYAVILTGRKFHQVPISDIFVE